MANQFQATPVAAIQAQYDLVIIGSGGAGLVAALQVHELGLHPVIFEKMSQVGGNTNRASSGMNASETQVQLDHQIVDSNQAFFNETLVGGGGFNDQALLSYFTTHGASAIDWLKEHGIILDDLTITGGMTVKRTHRPSSMAAIGGYLIKSLLEKLNEAQIPVFTETQVVKLQQGTTGEITGVTVKTADQEMIVKTHAVILASGGFGANAKMIQAYRPDLAGYQTTNQPGATGDGIQLAQTVGADLVDMRQIQVHPTVQQDTDHAYLIGEAVRGEGAILVDQTGRRFVNELDTRKNVTAAIDQLPDGHAYLIFDQSVRARVKAIEFYDHIHLVESAAEITELAQTLKMKSATLQKTVSDWNQAVTDQHDTQFGRTTGMASMLNVSPFYAIHIAPAVHYTMGGVRINPETQVLNTDQHAIPGLFAAGEVAGGLHGNNRIGGNSIAETVVFGRQAGQQSFKYLSRES